MKYNERMLARKFVSLLVVLLIGMMQQPQETTAFERNLLPPRVVYSNLNSTPFRLRAGFGPSVTTPNAKKVTKMDRLERKIQSFMEKEKGLEEAVTLYRALLDFQIAKQDTILNPFYVQKYNQFHENQRKYGWNEETIRRKMLEITWNAVAKERDQQHQLQIENLSSAKIEYLDNLCHWILSSSSSFSGETAFSSPSSSSRTRLLDVGCGNGILLKFLQERAISKGGSFSDRYSYTGIDISKEMIAIAKQRYPHLSNSFQVQSFLDHQIASDSSSPSTSYNCIVFHECFHYFSNISQALEHSVRLLRGYPERSRDTNTASSGASVARIVISHPKGIQNVQLQHSTNRLLVPSLLPTKDELLQLSKNHHFQVEYYSDKEHQYYLTVLSCS